MPPAFPGDFGPAFPAGLQRATEDAWRHTRTWSLSDFQRIGLSGCQWRPGHPLDGVSPLPALANQQPTSKPNSARSPADHRLFLATLHATGPPQSCA
jgi:hypothetical protein